MPRPMRSSKDSDSFSKKTRENGSTVKGYCFFAGDFGVCHIMIPSIYVSLFVFCVFLSCFFLCVGCVCRQKANISPDKQAMFFALSGWFVLVVYCHSIISHFARMGNGCTKIKKVLQTVCGFDGGTQLLKTKKVVKPGKCSILQRVVWLWKRQW